jgi:hypothetical protein
MGEMIEARQSVGHRHRPCRKYLPLDEFTREDEERRTLVLSAIFAPRERAPSLELSKKRLILTARHISARSHLVPSCP